MNYLFDNNKLLQRQPGIMKMVPGVLLPEEQNILQEKRKYAADKSDLLFLKSIEMEKCMK